MAGTVDFKWRGRMLRCVDLDTVRGGPGCEKLSNRELCDRGDAHRAIRAHQGSQPICPTKSHVPVILVNQPMPVLQGCLESCWKSFSKAFPLLPLPSALVSCVNVRETGTSVKWNLQMSLFWFTLKSMNTRGLQNAHRRYILWHGFRNIFAPN